MFKKIKSLLFLKKSLDRINHYLKNDLKKDIGADFYTSFSKKEMQRTEQYVRFHHLFGESLCLLFDRKMTKKEMKLFSSISIVAPIFDDFFDIEKRVNTIRLNKLTEFNDGVENKTKKEKTARYFLHFIYKNISLRNKFKQTLQNLIRAQRNSSRQQICGIDKHEITRIEAEKGGISATLYALLLAKEEYSEKEYAIFFELGIIGQFVDDIFDFYEDRENEIVTQANIYKNPMEISKVFEAKFQNFKQNLVSSKYSQKNIAAFLSVINIVISSARVCLLQFDSKIYKKHGSLFVDGLSRKEKICDMENKRNRFRMLRL